MYIYIYIIFALFDQQYVSTHNYIINIHIDLQNINTHKISSSQCGFTSTSFGGCRIHVCTDFFTGIKLGVDARIFGEWWMSPTKPSNFSWNIAFMLQGPHQGPPGHHDRSWPRGRKRENQPVEGRQFGNIMDFFTENRMGIWWEYFMGRRECNGTSWDL